MSMGRFVVVFVFLAIAFATGPVYAETTEPRLIATHGDWAAYVMLENGGKVCYMASTPKKAQGNYTRRGQVFMLITHRPGEGTRDVFSYITGYPYKPGSDATIKVGSERFTLLTQDEMAWTPGAEEDSKLVAVLRRGSTAVVTGTSSRGTLTTDTYSLSGSSAAYDEITKECGLK